MNSLTRNILRLATYLPLCVLYAIADVVLYPLMRHVVRYRRSVVEKNLALAFPQKTDCERLQIEKAFYHHLCDMLVETVYMQRISHEELLRRFQWENLETVRATASNEKKPVLCYFAHYGQWEWAIQSLMPDKSATTIFIYNQLHNSGVNDWILNSRTRFGIRAVNMQDVMKTVSQYCDQDNGCIIFAAADQLPKEQYVRHFHRFMGIKTKVLTGTEQLIRKFDMNVFYCRVERISRGHYTCKAKRLDVNETDSNPTDWPYTDAYFDLLQQQLHKCPELWLWSHDRWRR